MSSNAACNSSVGKKVNRRYARENPTILTSVIREEDVESDDNYERWQGRTRLFFGIQAVFEKRAYRTRFFFNQAVFKFGPTCFGTSSIINSTVVEQNFFRGNPKPGKLHIKLHCEKAILSFVVGLITERQLWYSNECEESSMLLTLRLFRICLLEYRRCSHSVGSLPAFADTLCLFLTHSSSKFRKCPPEHRISTAVQQLQI